MPSPFAKYQSEQVQQLAPGFVEAYGNAGRAIGQGIASAGDALAKGMVAGEQKRQENIKVKAALAPYIRNDDRITATEGMLKSGLLTKADDGTVAVSAQYAQYADQKGLKKYIDFYNETGGDGSRLSGDALTEFASRFEGEQKYIAEKASNDKNKIERELKQAQIAKLRAEAAAKANETGLMSSIMAGLTGAETPDSPTAGIVIDTTPYKEITPPPAGAVPAGVTKPQVTVPGVAAPAPAISPALKAGTTAAPKDEIDTVAAETGMTREEVISTAKESGITPKEVLENFRASTAVVAAKTTDIDTMAAEAGMTKDQLLEASRISGVSPEEHINNLRAVAAAAKPAPAAAPAAPAAAAPAAQEAATTPAAAPAAAPTTPAAAPAAAPEAQTYNVPAEAEAVRTRLAEVTTQRETVRAKYSAIRTKNTATLARQRQQALALGVVAPQKASAITSYIENSIKFQNEAEARELKALDDKESAINRDFANYQAADKAQRSAKTESAQVKKDETKAAADVREAKKQRLSDYPRYQVWNHLGSNMPIDKKTGLRLDPVDFDIKSLSPSAQIAVGEANEGYNKAVEFMVNLDKTLAQRVKGDQGWAGRFRLTADNMKNYYSGELASVFGVATFRRGIVSGGNFSDADREFVKQAITYINTAAPDLSPEDLKASLDALAVFVNNMYIRTLESNDMTFDSKGALAQAEKLEAAGMEDKAATIRETVERTDTFYSRFGMKPPGGNRKSYDKAATLAAFDLLYPKMKAKGFLKGADESK